MTVTKWLTFFGRIYQKKSLICTLDKVFFSKPGVYLTLYIEKFVQYRIFSIPAGVQNGYKTILCSLFYWPGTKQKQ